MVFVLHHALLFLVGEATDVEFVDDIHLRFGGASNTNNSRVHILRIVVIDSLLLIALIPLPPLVGASHTTSIELKLRAIGLVLRRGCLPVLLAKRHLSTLLLA